MTEYKQVIVIRKDLWMRRGKEIAQACHASLYCVLERADMEIVSKWLDGGSKKVVCKISSEPDLVSVYQNGLAAGLPTVLIRDAGRTEVLPNTPTAVAIGPAESDAIDKITGNLELY